MELNLYPKTWTYKSWRRFFFIAALWNFAGAVPSLIYPEFSLRLFYRLPVADFYVVSLNTVFWAAVLIFGLGYLMVAKRPGRNLGILVMGILAKIGVAVFWYQLFSTDRASVVALLAGIGDILFTLYFLYYLIRGPREPEQETVETGAQEEERFGRPADEEAPQGERDKMSAS